MAEAASRTQVDGPGWGAGADGGAAADPARRRRLPSLETRKWAPA